MIFSVPSWPGRANRLAGLAAGADIVGQDGVHAALIAASGGAEKRNYIGIETESDLLFVFGGDQFRDTPPAATGLLRDIAQVDVLVAQFTERLKLLRSHLRRIFGIKSEDYGFGIR